MSKYECNNCKWVGTINTVGALTLKQLQAIGVKDSKGFNKPEYIDAPLVHCPVCLNINLYTI
jgi:hypothetical protein